MQVFILNAPPHCGKDTIARILKDQGFTVAEFKAPMFDIAFSMSGMSREDYMREYEDRSKKESPQPHLGGLSYREFMIHISEDIMKPLFGDGVFGDRAAGVCFAAHNSGTNVVFSDGGFIEEVRVLHDKGLDVTVVRLHREGYCFGNDSRQYLYPDFCKSIDIKLVEGRPERAAINILSHLEL